MNSLSAKQQDKWKELDAFFKTNSKYYKQINNGNIVFTAWSAGSSGDYLNSLFLDSILDIDMYVNEIAENVNVFNRYIQQVAASPQNRITNMLRLDNYDQESSQSLLLQYRNLTKHFNIPTDFNIIDKLLHDALIESRKQTHYYRMVHTLPVIPYLYYKNPEKIKLVIIDISNANAFTQCLSAIKLRPYEYMPYMSDYVINTFNEIKQLTNNNELVNGIISTLLMHCDEKDFITYLEKYLNNTIAITQDLQKGVTGKTHSGMMDFLPNNQLYNIDYRDLFFNQDLLLIEQLMKIYNSGYDINYYKKHIKKYHERNLVLIDNVNTELSVVLKTLHLKDVNETYFEQ
jgi:hypothetical protein|tara:strand:+ start:525 stop:1559 length:1035 start_codon:yes stop_codon:yes gene_type:complete